MIGVVKCKHSSTERVHARGEQTHTRAEKIKHVTKFQIKQACQVRGVFGRQNWRKTTDKKECAEQPRKQLSRAAARETRNAAGSHVRVYTGRVCTYRMYLGEHTDILSHLIASRVFYSNFPLRFKQKTFRRKPTSEYYMYCMCIQATSRDNRLGIHNFIISQVSHNQLVLD